ncbi:MAG: ParB/RepB/Spo0J family partition protein [Leptospirales bacterium]|nr:ParB/RepB/Spo0J family partition protein [Leptospirales bacterium]
MAKKTLGRGLSNLIPGMEQAGQAVVRDNANYIELPLDEISANPNQPRKRFNDEDLRELARTLHSVGLIEPVVVRKIGDRFQLISGERRWRAARLAGFKKIPAVIKQVNDLQALEMGIIENIQREELNAVEEARAYDFWMTHTGRKASDLAELVGKDRTTITNLVRLLKLPEEILALLETGAILPGQARPLLAIGDRKTLLGLAARISREAWTARKVEESVARLTESTAPAGRKNSSRKDANVRQLEDKLRARLGARVRVAHKKGGAGAITIQYQNLEDLDRLLELLRVR